MKTYTVVLLYPDYISSDYGADLFVQSIAADNPTHAIRLVQELANQGGEANSPDDFKMILLLAGDCEVLGDAISIYETEPEREYPTDEADHAREAWVFIRQLAGAMGWHQYQQEARAILARAGCSPFPQEVRP